MNINYENYKNKLRDVLKDLDKEDLKFLYDKHLESFFHDNQQIWGNLSIIALANFITIFVVKILTEKNSIFEFTIIKVIIALFSILFALLWLINVEVHRAFQNKHQLFLEVIEEILIGNKISIPYKISDDPVNRFFSQKVRLIVAIRIFVVIYIYVWICIILFY